MAPVDDLTLFADRPGEVFRCLGALFQAGLHVGVYGERGAGKISLANIVPQLIKAADRDRFRNPLFQPFVKMAGRANRRIIEELADELQERQMLASASPVRDDDESSRLW